VPTKRDDKSGKFMDHKSRSLSWERQVSEEFLELKCKVARSQLVTALDLFLRDKDPISVQCLACGGARLSPQLRFLRGVVETFSCSIVPPATLHSWRTIDWTALFSTFGLVFEHAPTE
jgi:hypothetical protein